MEKSHSSEERSLNENESLDSSMGESITVDTSSEVDNILDDIDDSEQYRNISDSPVYKQMWNLNSIETQLEQIMPLSTYNNISVSNSTNVVFGNIIKVKGVLNINVFKDHKENKSENVKPVQDKTESPKNEDSPEFCSKSDACFIIIRNCWCAVEPLDDYKYIKEPVDIVVICHTGTEISTNTSRNMEILRNIQTFHIDTQGWDDIGYNFLIGCDGNIYEGRGWGVVGVHTIGYNSRSISIAFIGSFCRTLPTEKALKSCKNLLQRGIREDHLRSKFKLLGHRQCINTVSPGRFLYEEISKWENFYKKDIDDNMKH